jgi:hypothetical protein
MPTTQNLLEFIVALVFMNLSAIVIAVIAWRKSSKMLPKELKGADLENRTKELELADRYDSIAQKAADKAIKLQERLDTLESGQLILKIKVDEQAILITQQTTVIEAQSERMNSQEEEIAALVCELSNYRDYTNALIEQIKEANITPLDMKILPTIKDCNEVVKSARGTRGPQGRTGDKGSAGDKGSTGSKGTTGNIGSAGEQGIVGTMGKIGATGATGTTGEKGIQGIIGKIGKMGKLGDRGARGDRGDRGIDGDKGDKGDTGAFGEKGKLGDMGIAGDKGDKGDTGAFGEKGKLGDIGKSGDKGDTGLTGATGGHLSEEQ